MKAAAASTAIVFRIRVVRRARAAFFRDAIASACSRVGRGLTVLGSITWVVMARSSGPRLKPTCREAENRVRIDAWTAI
jgi:hypothetical protein